MYDVGRLGLVAVDGKQLTNELTLSDVRNQSGADSQTIALNSSQTYFEKVPWRETIFKDPQRASSGLPQDQVELSVVARVDGQDGAAVRVDIGSCQITDFQEVLSCDVQISAVTFKTAQIVLFKDVPGIARPELIQLLIDASGLGNVAVLVTGL